MKNCNFCGKEYKGRKNQKYCSTQCSSKSQVKRVTTNCSECGLEISLWESWLRNSDGSLKKYHYCDINCKAEHQKTSLAGENNPNYRSKEYECFNCSKLIKRTESYVNDRKRVYCSRECVHKHITVHNSGSNNASYNPSITDEQRTKHRYNLFGDNIKKWRKEIFERDCYTCQVCGDDRGGNLNAHHLNSWDSFEKERFDLDNSITLCTGCHVKFHREYGYGKNTKEQFGIWKQSLRVNKIS